MMATTQDRIQDETATAAKVIRILHQNHAAASDYLHSLHDASHMSRVDFRSYLRHTPLDEYRELVGPLDKAQKAILYEKVARMKDRTPTSPIDKETAKAFFTLLELKHRGLSFRDIRKEVNKTPVSADQTTTFAAVSTPRAEGSTKKKRKRTEDTPASASPSQAPSSTKDVDRQSKKRRTESPSVQPPPRQTSTQPPLSRSQRKREKQKARRAAVRASLVDEERSTVNDRDAVLESPLAEKSTVPELATPARPGTDTHINGIDGRHEPQTVATSKAESPAQPEQKRQRTRRARRRSKMTIARSPPEQTSPAKKDGASPMPSPDREPSEPENISQLHSQSDEPQACGADAPVSHPHHWSLAHGTEDSPSLPNNDFNIHEDAASPSSSKQEYPEENAVPVSPHRSSPAHDVDVSMSFPGHEILSSPSHECMIQDVTAPLPSPEHVPQAVDDSLDQEPVAQGQNLSTSSPERKCPAQDAGREASTPERRPAHQTGSQVSSPLHGSPKPRTPVPVSITRTVLPLATRPTIVTAVGAGAGAVSTERQVSPRPGSSSEFDLRAGPIAFSMPAPTSNPVSQITERQPVPSIPSFRNAVSHSLTSEFAHAQSSGPSVVATSSSARPRVIPSASTVTDISDFRNFSRFVNGKGLGEDDSSSDDEGSSSSSSSEDEADVRPPQLPPRTVTQASEPETRQEDVADDFTAMDVDAGDEQLSLTQNAETDALDPQHKEESSGKAVTEIPASEGEQIQGAAGDVSDENSETANQPINEPGPSIESADLRNTEHLSDLQEESVELTPSESRKHTPRCRVTSPSPVLDEIIKPSTQKTDQADPVTFTSFHESLSTQDNPSPSPVPEIPDLMDFGGYRPVYESELASSVLPGSCDTAPGATIPVSSQRSDADQEILQDNNETVIRHSEISKQSNISNHVSEPGPTVQTSDPSSPIQVNDAEPEVSPEEVREEDGTLSSSPIQYLGSDDATQEQAKLLDGFKGVFEQSEEQFSTRMASLRARLDLGTSGTVKGRKAMFAELLEETTREEAVYESKLSAARRAVERDVPEARMRMFKIIDHAGLRFNRTIASTRVGLQEEYDKLVSGSQTSTGSAADETTKDVTRPEVIVLVETPSQTYKSQFGNSSFASEQAYEAAFANTQDEATATSDSLEKAESEVDPNEKSPTQEPQKRKRRTTGVKSKHFTTPSPAKPKRVPAGTSAVPFPKLSAPRFGLIQEELAKDPFRLLIAVTFLNKTAGKAAVPIYRQLMELYPTPPDLAAASIADVSELIRPLGLQNQRAKKLVRLAETWVADPPRKGVRHRTRDYPVHGDGRDLKPSQTLEDAEHCAGALEIGHMYGLGPYAYDSWRIFCRDVFRGVAEGYNGQGVQSYSSADATSQSTFEPEWKRVVPADKELRACLRWMWLREGWEWDPLTGKKKVANVDLVRDASNGAATWAEPDGTPAEERDSVEASSGTKSRVLEAERTESPDMAKTSPGGVGDVPSPPVTRRATRSSTRLRMSRNANADVDPSPES